MTSAAGACTSSVAKFLRRKGLLARLPELQAALESLHLGRKEWDIDAAELPLGLGNLPDLLARLGQQPLLEGDHFRVDGAPMSDIAGIVAVAVFALHQPVAIDEPSSDT